MDPCSSRRLRMKKAEVTDLVRSRVTRDMHTVFGEAHIVLLRKTSGLRSPGRKVVEEDRVIPGVGTP